VFGLQGQTFEVSNNSYTFPVFAAAGSGKVVQVSVSSLEKENHILARVEYDVQPSSNMLANCPSHSMILEHGLSNYNKHAAGSEDVCCDASLQRELLTIMLSQGCYQCVPQTITLSQDCSPFLLLPSKEKLWNF